MLENSMRSAEIEPHVARIVPRRFIEAFDPGGWRLFKRSRCPSPRVSDVWFCSQGHEPASELTTCRSIAGEVAARPANGRSRVADWPAARLDAGQDLLDRSSASLPASRFNRAASSSNRATACLCLTPSYWPEPSPCLRWLAKRRQVTFSSAAMFALTRARRRLRIRSARCSGVGRGSCQPSGNGTDDFNRCA